MTFRFCRIHSVSRGIDNFDSSQVWRVKDGTKRGESRETGIFKSPFFKGRFAKSTLPFYCNFLSLPHWKLPAFLWGVRHPTFFSRNSPRPLVRSQPTRGLIGFDYCLLSAFKHLWYFSALLQIPRNKLSEPLSFRCQILFVCHKYRIYSILHYRNTI